MVLSIGISIYLIVAFLCALFTEKIGDYPSFQTIFGKMIFMMILPIIFFEALVETIAYLITRKK